MMKRSKPAWNAMLAAALLALYAGSYLIVRLNSANNPFHSGNSRQVMLGITRNETLYGVSALECDDFTSPDPKMEELAKRNRILKAVYSPMRFLDRMATGDNI